MAAANGRPALVTGAGRNIGRACVLGLAEDGFNVAINGSSDRAACDKVAKEAEKFGVKAIVVMGDVGKPEECKRIADEAIKAVRRRRRAAEQCGAAAQQAVPRDERRRLAAA